MQKSLKWAKFRCVDIVNYQTQCTFNTKNNPNEECIKCVVHAFNQTLFSVS